MVSSAVVVHAVQGRTRFRLASRKGDHAYFTAAVEQLKTLPGLHVLEANPLTGSIMLQHDAEVTADDIGHFAEQNGLFSIDLEGEKGLPVTLRASHQLQDFDTKLQGASLGELDFRSVVFLLLVSMAAVQLWNGRIMAPAVSLLWYAVSLLLDSEKNPPQ
ncbi:MAG: hypothetical protein P8Y64_11525 [Gammaproteobacteria bacterium]|jgi:hypothetical protein